MIAEETFVADPARESRHQDVVVHPIEEFLEVQVNDELTPLLSYVFPRLFQRHVGARVQAGIHSWSWKR